MELEPGSDAYRKVKFLTMKKLPVPAGVEEGYLTSRYQGKRQGNCYPLAGGFCIDNEEWELCHGVLWPPLGQFEGVAYKHGWCEKGNVVYDGVLNGFFNKKEYYEVFLPEKVVRYKGKEARRNMLKYENWGPWK